MIIPITHQFKFFIQNDSPDVIENENKIVNFLYEKHLIVQADIIEWKRIRDLQILTENDFELLVGLNKKISDKIRFIQRTLDMSETGVVVGGRSRSRRSIETIYQQVESFTSHGMSLPNISNLSWTYLNATNVKTPEPTIVRTSIHRSLGEWKKAFDYALGPNGMSFKEVNSERADIKVSFETGNHSDGYPFDGRGNVLAHAFYPGSSRSGVVHLDFDEDWDYQFLYNVLLHELGHSFGLGHSSVNSSTMYAWYTGKDYLDQDDFNGIFDKYNNRSVKIFGPIVPPTPVPTPTTRPRRKIVNKPVYVNRDKSVIYIYNSTVYIK
jgi:hypothetical protein